MAWYKWSIVICTLLTFPIFVCSFWFSESAFVSNSCHSVTYRTDRPVMKWFALLNFHFCANHVAEWSLFLRDQLKFYLLLHIFFAFLRLIEVFFTIPSHHLDSSYLANTVLWYSELFERRRLSFRYLCVWQIAFQKVGKICCVDESHLRGLIDNLRMQMQEKNLSDWLLKLN